MADGSPAPEIRVARKTRPMLVADLFCGAGGLSNGTARAMRHLGLPVQMIGVNHAPVAIETNRHNRKEHADRIHCADLESALPLTIVPEGRLDLLTAAPYCVFHSRTRGSRPVHDQQRMDPWHVVRLCTELRVARVLAENVPEFMDWAPAAWSPADRSSRATASTSAHGLPRWRPGASRWTGRSSAAPPAVTRPPGAASS